MLDKKGAYWLQQLPRSLEERIVLIRHFFDVKIHSLGAKGKTIIISGGFGLGMSLLDTVKGANFFVDVDDYKNLDIDWETIAIILSCGGVEKFVLAGWFFATKNPFDQFIRGITNDTPYFVRVNDQEPLADFINRVNS